MALVIASSLCRNTARASIRGCYLNVSTFSTRSNKQLASSFTSFIRKTVRLDKLKSFAKFESKNHQQFLFSAIGVAAAVKIKGIFPVAYCGLKLSHKNVALSKTKDTDSEITEESKPQPKFDFKEFFKLLLPDIWLLILASLSAFAVAMTNIHLPLLLGNLVNVVSNLASEDHARDYFEVLKKPVVQLFGLYFAQAGLTFVYISMLSCLGERLAERMRTALFASLIRQDISFFDMHKTGELINRLTADVQDFKSSFKQCISQGLKSTTQVIGCIGTMYYISSKLTGVIVILVPTVIIFGTLFGSLLRRLSRRAQEQVAKATAMADEALGNVRTVRAFAMEEKETDLYSKEVGKSKMLNEQLGFGIGAFQGGANFAINGLVLVVLYAGGSMLAVRELRPGDLMSFLVATQTIQRSLGSISVLFGQIIRGMSAGARVFEYMTIKPTIPVTGGKILSMSDVKGQVEFENITFTYPTRKGHVVLKNFSLSIERGKMVALCGPSGSGKSTVAALLERFYEVGKGRIILDGHDVKDLDPTWMRGAVIGYIHQEPILFATSIMENIRYGKPNATDEEVYEAAKLSNADTFIRQFPQGYSTVLGERGVTVSGGQRQRIAIARALLKNPAILILDEATSALDAESERLVQQALDRLTEAMVFSGPVKQYLKRHASCARSIMRRTVIVIAHRLSTIQGADKIVVLSHGKIQELGTHQQLMKKKGLYAELVRRQMQDEDDDDED